MLASNIIRDEVDSDIPPLFSEFIPSYTPQAGCFVEELGDCVGYAIIVLAIALETIKIKPDITAKMISVRPQTLSFSATLRTHRSV